MAQQAAEVAAEAERERKAVEEAENQRLQAEEDERARLAKAALAKIEEERLRKEAEDE